MKRTHTKGKRIRPADKNLVRDYALRRLVLLFLSVLLCFYAKQLLAHDWDSFVLLRFDTWPLLDTPTNYAILSVIVATLICFVDAALFRLFCKNKLKDLHRRQALAKMVLDNKWYISETRKQDSFFLSSRPSSREAITDFPQMYYKYEGSHIIITTRVTMGKFQSQLVNMQDKVQLGLFCEYVDRYESEPYYTHLFYYDLEKARLNISDTQIINGSLELMDGFVWDFDKKPHSLIVGGTGSGKTYLLLLLVKVLLADGAGVHICDPKNADLADLKPLLPTVYSTKDEMLAAVEKFADDMVQRSEEMKRMQGYRMGGIYRDVGLPPQFLIFDEYVAFIEMLDKRETEQLLSNLKRIAMLGRQAGYFLILACQRADAKYMADGLRSQFHFRVALGLNDAAGYKMLFNGSDKVFLSMPAGRGYADIGSGVVCKFYVPFIPKQYDFYREISDSLMQANKKDTTK